MKILRILYIDEVKSVIMKAAAIKEHGDIEKLEILEINIPAIKEEEVLIEVKAVALIVWIFG